VPEDYVHRIGRTGRAGTTGAAVSLVDREEMNYLKDIERLIKRQIAVVVVEGFVPPPLSAAALSGREDDRPPRQPGRSGAGRGGQSRSQAGAGRSDQNRGQPRSGNKPASSAPRTAAGGPKPAGGANPARNPRPAVATGAPTPNRRESHNTSHNASHNTARPQAALFSGKPKSGS
jgi:ATP-dependent RNA helicase RhlE